MVGVMPVDVLSWTEATGKAFGDSSAEIERLGSSGNAELRITGQAPIWPPEAQMLGWRLIENARLSEPVAGDSGLCYSGGGRLAPAEDDRMSVDAATVRRIAHLARIAVADDEVEHLRGEINAILAFVEQLSEVDVEGVEPMTSVTPMAMKKRQDVVTDGGDADAVLRNAPAREGNYFVVPKVVE